MICFLLSRSGGGYAREALFTDYSFVGELRPSTSVRQRCTRGTPGLLRPFVKQQASRANPDAVRGMKPTKVAPSKDVVDSVVLKVWARRAAHARPRISPPSPRSIVFNTALYLAV